MNPVSFSLYDIMAHRMHELSWIHYLKTKEAFFFPNIYMDIHDSWRARF